MKNLDAGMHRCATCGHYVSTQKYGLSCPYCTGLTTPSRVLDALGIAEGLAPMAAIVAVLATSAAIAYVLWPLIGQ